MAVTSFDKMKREPHVGIKHDWRDIEPLGVTITTASGVWLGTEPKWDPDMTDWPAIDIIDYFARELLEEQLVAGTLDTIE